MVRPVHLSFIGTNGCKERSWEHVLGGMQGTSPATTLSLLRDPSHRLHTTSSACKSISTSLPPQCLSWQLSSTPLGLSLVTLPNVLLSPNPFWHSQCACHSTPPGPTLQASACLYDTSYISPPSCLHLESPSALPHGPNPPTLTPTPHTKPPVLWTFATSAAIAARRAKFACRTPDPSCCPVTGDTSRSRIQSVIASRW